LTELTEFILRGPRVLAVKISLKTKAKAGRFLADYQYAIHPG
jgi:hypothetical protein